MKNVAYIFTATICVFLSLIFLYYIAVNTFLADVALPNVSVNSSSVSFQNKNEIEIFVTEKVLEDKPQFIDIQVDNYFYSVPLADFNISVNAEEIVDYGKGTDILKVISEGFGLIDGEILDINYTFDPTPVINFLPLQIQSTNPAMVVNNEVVGCERNEYYFEIDWKKLKNTIRYAFDNNQKISTSLFEIAKQPESLEIFSHCQKYNAEINLLNQAISSLEIPFPPAPNDIFALKVNNNFTKWEVKNWSLLQNVVNEFAQNNFVPVDEGQYEFYGNKLLMFKQYSFGRAVNIDRTIEKIREWLNNPTPQFPQEFDTITPNILATNREILDFTKLLGSGKSRIDLVRDGVSIAGIVANAEGGIRELQNDIVYPGEEYSFINAVKRVGWKTEQGYPIGGGTCNSTTTLFRAALEAGFPITKRQNHTFYVASYTWDYPLNIVDAAYYPNPQVDMRFVNDLDAPIIIRTVVERSNDGWQYHTIDIYTSSSSPERKVILKNWKKYNEVSSTIYTGSFDRIVIDNGEIVRQDTFKSIYNQKNPN